MHPQHHQDLPAGAQAASVERGPLASGFHVPGCCLSPEPGSCWEPHTGKGRVGETHLLPPELAERSLTQEITARAGVAMQNSAPKGIERPFPGEHTPQAVGITWLQQEGWKETPAPLENLHLGALPSATVKHPCPGPWTIQQRL